eukprot:6307675-Amphidinium_carterae.1
MFITRKDKLWQTISETQAKRDHKNCTSKDILTFPSRGGGPHDYALARFTPTLAKKIVPGITVQISIDLNWRQRVQVWGAEKRHRSAKRHQKLQ